MKNLWSDSEAQALDELDKLVYMSRLIGADPSLVVWGGGNTSIKITEQNFLGQDVQVMRIKGSGSDLKSMERWQFPRLELEKVLPVFQRERMSDEDMVDYLDRCVLDPNSPRPSIETLLHAFLPFHSVAHSHADAVVGLTNNRDANDILRRVYGDNHRHRRIFAPRVPAIQAGGPGGEGSAQSGRGGIGQPRPVHLGRRCETGL